MKTKIIILTIFALQLFTATTYAQKDPIRYGKIDIEDLQTTHYDKDSSAVAVVLCEYGYWDLRDYKFRRIVRIKILTPEGLAYANQTYNSSEGTSIRGKTYNIVNGEIEVTKLKHESVYKERIIEDYFVWNVAMPNVKVGSVFDIEYSHFDIPYEWRFQKDIPVKFSELIIPESMYIKYSKRSFGNEPLALSTRNHWVARDMPAFKSEPYVNSADNYVTKFEFDIQQYTFPGYYKEFTTDWDAVARRLDESDYFGGRINAALYLSAKIKEIKAQDSTDYGRMKLAYETAKEVKWNKLNRLQTTSQNLGENWREKIGNSADVNIILINLLRKLDLNTHPIVLSTRSNGTLTAYSPSINKLDYVIIHVKIDEQDYYLDATEEYAPLGILPKRCLNNNAVMVNERKAKVIPLNTDKKNIIMKMCSLKLEDDLSLSGNFSNAYREYGALDFRNYYYSFNSEDELIDKYEEENSNLSISNYEAVNINEYDKSAQEKYNVKINNQVQQIDSLYYLTPLLHLATTENPFKLEERKYPIDFAYCRSTKYIIQIAIPEGFYVKEMPKPIVMALPENGGRVVYQMQNQGNMISVIYQLDIKRPTFGVKEYTYLRELYNQIIKKQAEPIILAKN